VSSPVNYFAVGRSTSVSDPDAGTRVHYRLKGGDHAAGWVLDLYISVVFPFVDVRFAIRYNDYLFSV
jgi:hypothetical protein